MQRRLSMEKSNLAVTAPVHLLRIPLDPANLYRVAASRGISGRTLDSGYFAHCITREIWQERAPAPFVLRGNGRRLDIWGYSCSSAEELLSHLEAFADPLLCKAIGDRHELSSRKMPIFKEGQRIGFQLRACPVVRLSKASYGHNAGSELDAYKHHVLQLGTPEIDREEVYRRWLIRRLNATDLTGVTVNNVKIAGFSSEALVRRTQGETREAVRLLRPDVHFEGEITVQKGEVFNDLLIHGVGRHKAFGFGALIVVPPGSAHPRS
jgi:CRISPR system Cascade subunit CasE